MYYQYLMPQLYYYSQACGIDLGDSLVITGGYWGTGQKTVTEYTEDGQHKELPEMNTGRHYHGCSSFVDGANNIVSNSLLTQIIK